MKLDYDAETDYLYIRLKEGSYLESEEVANGFVFDFDKDGSLLGIEIEHASEKIDLTDIEVSDQLPKSVMTVGQKVEPR